MSIQFDRYEEGIWVANGANGQYRCMYTGSRWAVFFNDAPVATGLISFQDAMDCAAAHNNTEKSCKSL